MIIYASVQILLLQITRFQMLTPVHSSSVHILHWPQHLVKKFLALAHKFSLPVFLVDTASLSLLSRDAVLLKDSQMKEPHCTFLCTHKNFVTFGLLGNLWKYDVGEQIVESHLKKKLWTQ